MTHAERMEKLEELAGICKCIASAAPSTGWGVAYGLWQWDLDRMGQSARKLIDELFPPLPQQQPETQEVKHE